MGKRSQQKMTGLSLGQRIKRSEKRKAEEQKRKAKEALEFAKAMLEPSVVPTLPTLPVFTSPTMSRLLEIEQSREQEKRKKKP